MKTNLLHRLGLWMLLCVTSVAVTAQQKLQDKLSNISEIADYKVLESTEFTEKYVTYFVQPIDHATPSLGDFRQRVIVCHVGFDRPTVLVTEGYGATYAFNPRYREELSKLLDANMIFVEHRYFLESTPEPRDWKYLTTQNSADDLHAIRNAFKKIYPGKWIATGISKGGQTTMLYRTYYPDDVDISVPYVAPLCYGEEDGRHEPFLRNVSTMANRKVIEDFQLEVLKRKATLLPRFEAFCKEKGYQFRTSFEEIYDFCVLEYSFAFWQWGDPVEGVPSTNASDDELFNHFITKSDPSYFVGTNNPYESFFVQAARELGYYGYDVRPFKKYLSIKSSKGYLRRLMMPIDAQHLPWDKTLGKKITKFLKKNDPKMIFIYGENDPWTAAGVTWLDKNKQNMHMFMQEGGSHRARISTLSAEQQAQIMQILKGWLEE